MKNQLFLTGKMGAKLDILLENMGRLSFGSNHSDFKVRWVFAYSFFSPVFLLTTSLGMIEAE
jgi:hypothetical protein